MITKTWIAAGAGALLLSGMALSQCSAQDVAALTTGTAGGRTAAAPLTKEAVWNDAVAPAVAPQGADVTMVMFFDYACPVCRRTHPDVRRLLAQDKKIRFVYRDWPIFGGASVEAARAAIGSKYQGKHSAFDDALMRMPSRLSSATIRQAANKAGVDWARLQADLKRNKAEIDALLARNGSMAPAIGLQGTPGFIIGSYMVPGGMDLAGLKQSIADARNNPNGPPEPKPIPVPANLNAM